MTEQKIACPNCNNHIFFSTEALLQGQSFSCAKCDSKISLARESKELVEESMQEFNKLKQNRIKTS